MSTLAMSSSVLLSANPKAYVQSTQEQSASGYAAPAYVQNEQGHLVRDHEAPWVHVPYPGYNKEAPIAPYVAPTEAPVYTETPYVAPTDAPYVAPAPATPPPDFVSPKETYPIYHPEKECAHTNKPNSAKYMAYVCSSLYAQALKWGNNNCAGYYAVESAHNKNSLYQARLCTYWTQKSVMRVVTSCFIEAHLRNEFVMKHGKEGPGVWYCRYREFVDQVLDCYKGSLKYYPLGESMNEIEKSVANLYTPNKDDMPAFEFTGASVAMCAYYNKDQVYNRGTYY